MPLVQRSVLPLALSLIALAASASLGHAQTVMVPMRDGVSLATDIYGAASGGPKNVILHQTPYGKWPAATAHTMNLFFDDQTVFTSWGVIYVVQDMRGTGDSEGGDTDRFLQDHRDTQDTIAWIKAQPWFGGKLMTYGLSATGTAATLAIQGAPPELVCNVALLSTGDIYGAFYPGGAWRKSLADAWLPENAGASIPAAWKAHETRSSFWDDGVITDAEITGTHVFTYYIAGQYDVFRDAPSLFRRLRALSANPAAHYLTLGPWTHNDQGIVAVQQGDLVLPLDSTYLPGQPLDPGVDMEKVVRHCLGSWPAPNFAKVRYYTTEIADVGASTGYWSGADTWPPPGVVPTKRYLSGSGLAGTAPAAVQTRVAVVDPSSPVPSHGGGELLAPAGPRLQGGADQRADVLVFETPAATTLSVIAGDLSAEIWAASNTSDLDVIVRVSEILKDGRTVLLTDGVRRGRFVGGYGAIVPLTPGAPAKFEVDLGALAFRLPVGHKLRVAIQGTSAPRYEVNPNQAVALASSPTPVATGLTLYAGPGYPSAVTFPVLSGTLPDSNTPPPPPPSGGGGGGSTSCQASVAATDTLAFFGWIALALGLRGRARPFRARLARRGAR